MLADLKDLGLVELGQVYCNLPTPRLYEEIVRRGEGLIAHTGPVVVNTGKYTGRSPADKFIIQEPSSAGDVWWGKVNRAFAPERFEALLVGAHPLQLVGRTLHLGQ